MSAAVSQYLVMARSAIQKEIDEQSRRVVDGVAEELYKQKVERIKGLKEALEIMATTAKAFASSQIHS